MYHHSSEIPMNVAMAIHAVAHNKATESTWLFLTNWWKEVGDDKALDLVIDTIKSNSPDADLEGERAWWAREMIGH